jgi:small subunit ribosomal protein S8
MLDEGFIKGYEVFEKRAGVKVIKLQLSYFKDSFVIKKFSAVSTPGLRMYSGAKKIQQFFDGLGIVILSTNRGILTDKSAKQLNVGGEVLCKIF